jgi:hypothetical protein
MSNAAITSALTRAAAFALVERAERHTGSRMAAYQMVASTVGTSPDWLRKFIKGREAKEPGWTAGWNILDQYNRICNRVEQENETERVKILALKEKIDAATSSIDRMVETTQDAQASRTRGK